MFDKTQKIILYLLILFSIYCALSIGLTWDEDFHIKQGKVVLDYLFSFGAVDKDILYRENYSAIYWTLSYLITKQFPQQYFVEVSHIINLCLSLGTIFGIGKLGRELFNKNVGKIVFLILFFYPLFFGHMAINSKDTVLAFSHVWITYLLFRYIKKQHNKIKANSYIISLAVLTALSSGIQMVFIGSLIPLIIFISLDIFLFKKIVSQDFSKKKLFYDVAKCFILFYILIIFFWIDVHENIFVLPFNFLLGTFSESYWTGWPFNLMNGTYYLSSNMPKYYLLNGFFYKSPEYILLCYLLFIPFFLIRNLYFKEKFKFFNYKIMFIIFVLTFPNVILFLIPYPIYDGLRLFFWALPYISLIPGLIIYYFLNNFKLSSSKICLSAISILVIYFLYNFFSITPYQYTYLNVLNGKSENRYEKYENDYWGASIKELIIKSNFSKDSKLLFATCGVNYEVAKHYLQKKSYSNIEFTSIDKAKYIIMTNRVVEVDPNSTELKLSNCFNHHKGNNVFEVKRNGLILSAIRSKN